MLIGFVTKGTLPLMTGWLLRFWLKAISRPSHIVATSQLRSAWHARRKMAMALVMLDGDL